jgi:3-vinyl bacteriochlorophyllide hydratase
MGREDLGTNLQSRKTVRERREASVWTKIHPIFALGQLLIFCVSLTLLGLYFLHVVPFSIVHVSVLVKMAFMAGAIVTGSLWERDVYGRWWFALQFIIEDVMTANVFLLHIAYVTVYYLAPERTDLILSLLGVAYAVYGLNVAQYIVSHLRTQRMASQSADLEEIAA